MKKDTVGIVKTEFLCIDEGIRLECGKFLSKVTVAYETYGVLNKDKTNAVYIFHALSGDAHVAGYHSKKDKKPGWWEYMVGPGKGIDTNKYFVICSNVVGGCKGSTGPSSINPKTKKPYALDFPIITIKDIVYVQKKLLEKLGINKVLCVIGGSMGGMQVLEFISAFPDSASTAIMIGTAVRQPPQGIAFHEVGRQAIMRDPFWKKGQYYGKKSPDQGLSVARMISHITYLSKDSMQEKFGRRLQDKEAISYDFGIEFQVESYLNHQGLAFVQRFDANSYLYITRAIDYFDLGRDNRSISGAFKNTKTKCLVMSISSDWLYTTTDCLEIVGALRENNIDTSFIEINSSLGHDAFLIEDNRFSDAVGSFIKNYHEAKK